MTEDETRAAVVAEARSWLKTPYHNCADIKGVGVDCGMLIVRVFCDLGLLPPFDPRPYAHDWHLHKNAENYIGYVTGHCDEVEAPKPGDLMLFHYGRCYSHGGIVSALAPLAIVHAYAPWRRVAEMAVGQNAELNDPRREPRFFSFWRHAKAAVAA